MLYTKVFNMTPVVLLCPFAKWALRALPFCLCLSQALAQGPPDLRADASFFRAKIGEMNAWFEKNQLADLFRADSVYVERNRVTLYVRPAKQDGQSCIHMQNAWNEVQKANRKASGEDFHNRLLHKWAFLAEVHEDQAEVVVRCHDPAHFRARIYNDKGRIPVELRTVRSGAIAQVALPQTFQDINNSSNKAIIAHKNVGEVCTKARIWLVNYYKPKGTPILWRARIDDSYALYDEFVIEVTHISNEICPDGYFEYHRINVTGVQKGPDVELTWDFQGKYGSGIIFAPRKNDYKDLNNAKYGAFHAEYQRRLFNRMVYHLRR